MNVMFPLLELVLLRYHSNNLIPIDVMFGILGNLLFLQELKCSFTGTTSNNMGLHEHGILLKLNSSPQSSLFEGAQSIRLPPCLPPPPCPWSPLSSPWIHILSETKSNWTETHSSAGALLFHYNCVPKQNRELFCFCQTNRAQQGGVFNIRQVRVQYRKKVG